MAIAVAHVVLIGFRGAGKTSVGERLAVSLGRAFVDTDREIVTTVGRTIKDIFNTEGEAAFRRYESAAIAKAVEQPRAVIATGAGAVERPENVALLKRTSKLIWLSARAEVLDPRVSADPQTPVQRPSQLRRASPDDIEQLLARRMPLYRAAADAVVDVSDVNIEQAVLAVEALLRTRRWIAD